MVKVRMNDDLVAAGSDEGDMKRRRDDDDRAEERVPATDIVREPPSTVDIGIDIERHNSDVEDEVGY